MNIIAIIIARNGSSRVPKKSLLELSGKPLIWHMIRITKKINFITDICLATSDLKEDDSLAQVANEENINLYRGDSQKVLDRIYNAAVFTKADVVVYIGGDCPLLDPSLVSDSIKLFLNLKCDYLSNYNPPTFPGGQDINIISFKALKKAFQKAVSPSQRIHAFSYLTFHPNEFKINNFNNPNSFSEIDTYHWYIDYMDDIIFIKKIYEKLYDVNEYISMQNVLDLISEDEEIKELNNKLIKPKVKHSFFSSPSIMTDITNDIIYLNDEANKSIINNDFERAEELFYEIACITSKLSNKSF